MAWYMDTSAFLKLVVSEDHSPALRQWAEANEEELFSSDLMRGEALRSARRHSPEALLATRNALDAVALLPVTHAAYELAAELDPAVLRTLDALHLGVALGLGHELEGVATYDDRLAAAARLYGITVATPA